MTNISPKNNQQKFIALFSKTLRFYILASLTFVILFPFFIRLSFALRSRVDFTDPSVYFIPATWTLNNFVSAFQSLNFMKLFFNTLFLSFGTAFIQVVSSATCGYAFAKLRFKGSTFLFYLILFTIIIPKETLHISRVLFFSTTPFLGINLIGNIFSIFIMSFFGMGYRSGMFIYIFRQYFKNVSKEMEESAQIDGAGVFKTFMKISFPSAKGATLTVFILSFVWTWNDFYLPNFFNLSSVGFRVFSTQFVSRRLTNIDAAALLMMIPLLIGYLYVQKRIIHDFVESGMK